MLQVNDGLNSGQVPQGAEHNKPGHSVLAEVTEKTFMETKLRKQDRIDFIDGPNASSEELSGKIGGQQKNRRYWPMIIGGGLLAIVGAVVMAGGIYAAFNPQEAIQAVATITQTIGVNPINPTVGYAALAVGLTAGGGFAVITGASSLGSGIGRAKAFQKSKYSIEEDRELFDAMESYTGTDQAVDLFSESEGSGSENEEVQLINSNRQYHSEGSSEEQVRDMFNADAVEVIEPENFIEVETDRAKRMSSPVVVGQAKVVDPKDEMLAKRMKARSDRWKKIGAKGANQALEKIQARNK